MQSIFSIESIPQLHEIFEYEKPRNALFSIVDLSKIQLSSAYIGQKCSSKFYTIALKTKSNQSFKYGKNTFDFDHGCLYGIAPHQAGEVIEAYKKGEMEGWALYFHPDFIKQAELGRKISAYGFFSYNTSEALHISEEEKNILHRIFTNIQIEYESPSDEFSQSIILSNIHVLLDYISRYYNRQFQSRQTQNSDILSEFEQYLKNYLDSELLQKNGIPSVKTMAAQLHRSPAYLSDLLKKETGKSPQEHIHALLIEKAKPLLQSGHLSIAEIAYELGFNYAPYFSKLFKSKTGLSPSQYQSDTK